TVFELPPPLPKTIGIVDGIDCMEGDGAIMGTLKRMGLILVGTCPAAVDATICRLMEVDPLAVPHLKLAVGGVWRLTSRLWGGGASAQSHSCGPAVFEGGGGGGGGWPARLQFSTSPIC